MNMHPGIARLYENRLLRTELECEHFDQALEGLAGDTEDRIIHEIFRVFDDETEQEEIKEDRPKFERHVNYVLGKIARSG